MSVSNKTLWQGDLDTSILDAPWSVRARNAFAHVLERDGHPLTIRSTLRYCLRDIANFRDVGSVTIHELKNWAAENGLVWGRTPITSNQPSDDYQRGHDDGVMSAIRTLALQAQSHTRQEARNKETRSWEAARLERASANALEHAVAQLRTTLRRVTKP